MTSVANRTLGTPEMKNNRKGDSGIKHISTKTWLKKNRVEDPEGQVCWSGYSPQQRRDSQSQSDSASQSSQSQGNDNVVSPSVMIGDVGRRKLNKPIMPPSKKSKSNFGRTRSFEEMKSKKGETKKQKNAVKAVVNKRENDSGKGSSETTETSPEFPEDDDDDIVKAMQEVEKSQGSLGAVPETTPKRFVGSSRINNRRVDPVQISTTSGVPAYDRRENKGLDEISLQTRLPVSKPVPISCNDDDDAFDDSDDELFSQVEIPDA